MGFFHSRVTLSSSKNAVTFSSACTTKIVRPLESTAETQPKLQPALLRLSAVRLDVLKELGEEMNFWINGPRKLKSSERNTMLWTIIVILVVLWLLGFLGHVGGGLIHLLLVVAVVVLIINLIQGRRGL